MTSKLRSVASVILEKGSEFLIVRKPRKNHAWQFPQGGVDEGESLLGAAKRELGEECGKDLQVEFMSSDSVGEYSYSFPVDFVRHHGEFSGARVQFFRARFISGEVEVDGQEIVESLWVKKEELSKYFDQKYLEAIWKFL